MKPVKILLSALVMLRAADLAFAQAWTPTSAPNQTGTSIASSADGSKLIATGSGWNYFTSTNSGADWVSNSEPQTGSSIGSWNCIAVSADGNKMVAAAAATSIWVSTNAGISWTSNNVAGTSAFSSVAMSADGNKLAAVTGGTPSFGLIYTSTNSGMTWAPASAPSNHWTSVASSADGNKLVAVAWPGPIYTSKDSGSNWTNANAPDTNWVSVASSADGYRLVAVSPGAIVNGNFVRGSVYTSTNSGMTWMTNNGPKEPFWQSVASSADGSKLVAVAQGAHIYVSTNSGMTWITNSVPNQIWYDVASSADGGSLVAVVSGGGIYSSRTISWPQLNIVPSFNSLALSWIIPSTNFALQQSSNLTAWVTLTNVPVLNLTNLQNEVTFAPSNTSSFYRLKTP